MNDIEDLLSKLQSFMRTKPIFLIGSGLSISMGLPGMSALQQELKKRVPCLENFEQFSTEWEKCSQLIDKYGLEDGLSKGNISSDLLNVIVEATGDFIEDEDSDFRRRLLEGQVDEIPIAKIIKHVLNSLPGDNPNLDVITSNYDHLIEYACDNLQIHCNSGFSGTQFQTFAVETLKESLYAKKSVPKGKKTGYEFRKRKQVRLYKPHGSLYWRNFDGGIIQYSEPLNGRSRVIITPGLTKYEASLTSTVMNGHREMANESVRKAQSVFIIGYGFNDSHLQTVLIERLQRGLECLILTHRLSDNAKEIIDSSPNIIALEFGGNGITKWYHNFETGEVIGDLWNLSTFVKEVL
jgi:hypothetical protein